MRCALALVAGLVAVVGCSSYDVSRTIGARCSLDVQCDERCLSTGEWPGGFCTTSCDTNANCAEGSTCIAEQGGVCVLPCAIDADCHFLGATYACKSVDAQVGGSKVMVCRGN